jgi:dolichol-phosphate mannosyltransferase
MSERVAQVSVVVPTFNERDNLAPLAARVFSTLAPDTSEMLIIDDDSPDGTAAAARKLSVTYPIRCLVRRDERGLATAVIRGLREAAGRAGRDGDRQPIRTGRKR